MRKNTLLWQTLAAAFIILFAGAQAQIPQVINHQSQVADGSGNPLTGTHTIVFGLYDDPTGGNLVWDETHTVTMTNGFYSVLLGDGMPPNPIPLNLFDLGKAMYLQVTIDGQVSTPRQRLGSVPYAFHSRASVSLDQAYDQDGPGAGRTIIADAGAVNIAGPDGLTVNGNVGIGTPPSTLGQLYVKGSNPVRILGDLTTLAGSEYVDFMARNTPFNSELGGMRIQRDPGTGDVNTIFMAAAAGNSASEKMRIGGNGNVGIGTASPDFGGFANGGLEISNGVIGALALTSTFTGGRRFIIASHPVSGLVFRDQTASVERMRIDPNGNLVTQVLQITGGSDLSEQFEVNGTNETESEAALEQAGPGMVVSIDPNQPGKLMISTEAYDHKVAGIISGAGGINTGMLMGQNGSSANGSTPVALAGRVYCWADASYGEIKPGDLLTSSETPGHAMKVTDHAQAQGAILGKAMTSLANGKGLVLILVTLQ